MISLFDLNSDLTIDIWISIRVDNCPTWKSKCGFLHAKNRNADFYMQKTQNTCPFFSCLLWSIFLKLCRRLKNHKMYMIYSFEKNCSSRFFFILKNRFFEL